MVALEVSEAMTIDAAEPSGNACEQSREATIALNAEAVQPSTRA